MPTLNSASNTSRLLSTAGTFGECQIVAAPDRVLIDVTARNYDTHGHLHHERALLNLPLDAATRLRDLLDLAIDHAFCVTLDSRPMVQAQGGRRAAQ